MSVSAMKKLTAVVIKDDADRLMRTLMWQRCVQVVKTEFNNADDENSGNAHELKYSEVYAGEYRETSAVVRKLEKAIKILGNYATPEIKASAGIFGKREEKSRQSYDSSSGVYIDAYSDVERVEEIGYTRAEYENERNSNLSSITSLTPWIDCDIPLEVSKTKETRIEFGTFPATMTQEALAANLADTDCAFECVSTDSTACYYAVAFPKADENLIYQSLLHLGFSKVDLRAFTGTARQNIGRLRRENAELEQKLAGLDSELKEIASRLPQIRAVYDYTATRLAQMEAKEKLAATESCVILTAFVPQRAEQKVIKALESIDCSYQLDVPDENDTVPVLLNNPSPIDAFESVVGMYSMPYYGTFDPTFIMAIFYFVIFGFMLADVAYGLLITIACAVLYKKANLGDGIKQLLKLFAVCGVSCTIAGALFGSIFGDFVTVFAENMLHMPKELLPSLALWFDPISNPIMFLVLSIAIGVVHLMTGIGIEIYILIKEGRIFEAIFDQGSWFLIFLGASIAALGAYLNFPMTVGIAIVLAAVVMLVFTQGRAQKNILMKVVKGVGSLYGIVNYVSDLLSYSRIMALGLSSAVVASVMNLLATLIGPSIVGYVAMVVIFVVGHLLNLAINLLGSFVHASRLQYIEFFGKFFTDGGKPFKPLTPVTKYTNVQ